ncbi:MAG: alpha/beta hydrolase [Muribaculaceae bacterium]
MLAIMSASNLWAQNAQVKVVEVKASKMTAPVKCTIIVPEEYADAECQEAQYPVLYLLHGHGGDNNIWFEKKPDLPDMASQYSTIIVCPDGRNSWYWDSPIDPQSQFETFVVKDLVDYIDNNYRTIPEAGMRAITGLSMGGHGALFLALRHPDVFGSCGSMSGGVDIRPFPDSWGMKTKLGEYATNQSVWDSHTVITMIPALQTTQNIVFECGVDDFFIEVNRALHQAMVQAKIKHDYTERPGNHSWAYWCNALDYQMLFFSKIFDSFGI